MYLANCGRRYSLQFEFGALAGTRSNFCCIGDYCADNQGRQSPQKNFLSGRHQEDNFPQKLSSESSGYKFSMYEDKFECGTIHLFLPLLQLPEFLSALGSPPKKPGG